MLPSFIMGAMRYAGQIRPIAYVPDIVTTTKAPTIRAEQIKGYDRVNEITRESVPNFGQPRPYGCTRNRTSTFCAEHKKGNEATRESTGVWQYFGQDRPYGGIE